MPRATNLALDASSTAPKTKQHPKLLKQALFVTVRAVHRQLLLRELPQAVAIYFHELETFQWESFRQAIEYFTASGYKCYSADQFAIAPPDEKRLFISFDDNFANWHQALYLLDQLGVRATFYVNTKPIHDICDHSTIDAYFGRISYCGPSTTLTRTELREIAESGHTIGCHSHSHFNLSALPRELWDREIKQSKMYLEDLLGREVSDFSYPYGMRRHFSEALHAYCVDLGFRTIATGIPGLQHTAQIDPLSIYRTGWKLFMPLEENLVNLRIDGRLFEQLTGRSATG